MSRPLGGGVTVNANRPNPGVKSQLHTPLTAKQSEDGAIAAVAMPSVRREAAERNPLDLVKQTSVGRLSSSGESQGYPQKNPVDLLLQNFLTNCRIQPLNGYVPETLEGLNLMSQSGDWRSVVDISSKLVKDSDYLDSESKILSPTLQLRFEGLFRMKFFDDLSSEISRVLSAESQSKVADNSMSFKVVSLYVLLCEIKSLTGRGAEALEQLYKLRSVLSTLTASDGNNCADTTFSWWRIKIWNQIINVLLRQRQYHLALHEMSLILTEIRRLRDRPGPPDSGRLSSSKTILLRAEIIMLCRVARILLQIGAVSDASKYVDEARALMMSNGDCGDCISYNHTELTLGILFHIQNKYEEAVDMFKSVIKRIQSSVSGQSDDCLKLQLNAEFDHAAYVFSSRPIQERTGANLDFADCMLWHIAGAATAYEGTLMSAAVNNMSTSLLFLRRISEAMGHLEVLIQADPIRNMTDPVVFNLCTMYDLSSSQEISGYKKKVLQSVAAVYKVYDLSYKSFRL